MRTKQLRAVVHCTVALLLGSSPSVAGPVDQADPVIKDHVSRYNVIWDSPSIDAHGSMPLGNGDVGINAWIEPSGDLVFYIGKTDAWGENGRLLKVGKVRVTIDPPPPTHPFQQTLTLRDGTMTVQYGEGADQVTLDLWVDANHPTINVELHSTQTRTATASIELWRIEQTPIPQADASDLFEDRSKPNRLRRPVMVEPDILLDGTRDAIGWFHHNSTRSDYQDVIEIQGLADYFQGKPDPLFERVFGGVITAPDGSVQDNAHLVSPHKTEHRFSVHVLTEHPSSPEQWQRSVAALSNRTDALPLAERKAAHTQWWRAFWDRSWINVTQQTPSPPQIIPSNGHPVRIGIDQHNANRFVGEFGRLTILPTPMTDIEIKALARIGPNDSIAKQVGSVFQGTPALATTINDSNTLTFNNGLTIEAWVKPGDLPPGGGRIIDKTTPGVSDGMLLDTYPGNSLRLIAGKTTLQVRDVLPADQWTHVAAVVDPNGGHVSLYVNGSRVASERIDTASDAFVVSRAYALQRYVDACAGRGRYPIKFNGSLFNVAYDDKFGDADYRRWGPGYWWQNTRLPYLSMCASGDFEMMQPLFRMYADDLMAVHEYRTKQYTGHAGAFIPECIYFWGGTFSATYGWTPYDERGEDKLQESGWHKREWVSGLELVWMMLDYYEHTNDNTFLRDTLLPAADPILTFFDEQYETDENGKLVMDPSMALETWWDCTNPMPEVAGLRAVTARLLTLPEAQCSSSERAFWIRLRSKTPDLPTRTVDGVQMLAPAARFENKSNVENPELYAVFPFRLVSFNTPDVQLGIEALNHRSDRGHFGWRQDDLFMTHLGLADDARKALVQRARNKHAASRFPAFWGPNYDWVPDQDHGGVLMRTLQTMLMQTDGKTIHLLPAWPSEWETDFKLHAPDQTTISGRVRNGTIEDLVVTPESRRDDIVIHGASDAR
jgi:Domain of unknown function (DUF5703)/Concanavalin A-like lectin/glucanases superfamily